MVSTLSETPQKYVVNGVAIKTDWAVHQVANLTPDYCLGWLKHFKYVDQNATVCPRPLLGGNFLPRDSLPVTDLDIMQVKEILTESYLSALMINDFEAARAAYAAESARTDLNDDKFIAFKDALCDVAFFIADYIEIRDCWSFAFNGF